MSRIDKTLLSNFTGAYEILHLHMGYQGIQTADTASLGLKKAEKIIDWVETRLEKKNQ
ncbi:hypothetical protein GCM10010967_58690 [Dyadobacter beijingensis]|uniref:DUF5618 domain-containing protein n=1 Tax=Dyadobacter beijingensis TaxID=365489 RepID=A0ABQ2IJQ2_9BACT|nr:hypothetical protein GCM10010967_58690 [Dyadobacter beijingensis]